jgi:hypothetical protein
MARSPANETHSSTDSDAGWTARGQAAGQSWLIWGMSRSRTGTLWWSTRGRPPVPITAERGAALATVAARPDTHPPTTPTTASSLSAI